MSNVFVSRRKETGKEYYDVASELWIELRRITGSPEIFPKRTLYTDIVPMIQTFKEMRKWLTKMETRYPTDEYSLKVRKEYLQRAIESAEDLFTQMQDSILAIPTVTPDRAEHFGQLLLHLINMLRKMKKNAKIEQEKPKPQHKK